MSSPESLRHSSVRRCVPERPKVQPAFAQDPALMPDETYYTALFTRFLHRCSDSELNDLRVWFQHVTGGQLHIATACSGTDVPLLVYNGLASAVTHVLGVDVQVIHQFSCERNKAKQAFIKSMFEDEPLMFVDATKLGSERCFDAISGKEVKVPEGTESFLVGWPCTDVPTMNKYASSSQNRACVISGDLRTGGVFRGVLEFCKSHGDCLDVLCNENVPSLARACEGELDNLSAAVWLLDHECDMSTKAWVLNPMMFGVPQSRDRLWFPSFRRAALRDLGMSDEMASSVMPGVMNRLVGCKLADMDLYFLPGRHPFLQKVIAELPPQKSIDKQIAQNTKWPRMHYDLFQTKGLRWNGTKYPTEEECERYPMLQRMSLREFDILHARGVDSFPSSERKLVEVSQSLYRTHPVEADFVKALTPRIKYYISELCRYMVGIEELRLQSIHFPLPERLLEFPNELLRNLSGNAFEGSCCASVVFACCVLLSSGAHRRWAGDSPVAPRDSSTSAEVDSDIDDVWVAPVLESDSGIDELWEGPL